MLAELDLDLEFDTIHMISSCSDLPPKKNKKSYWQSIDDQDSFFCNCQRKGGVLQLLLLPVGPWSRADPGPADLLLQALEDTRKLQLEPVQASKKF
jgi:hypothetical protein